VGYCQFALADRVVGDLLSIGRAAEELVCHCIAGLYVEQLVQAGSRFVDVTLLKKSICLGGIGEKRAKAAEKNKGSRKADAGRICCQGHG
jgi:hypothetical protein